MDVRQRPGDHPAVGRHADPDRVGVTVRNETWNGALGAERHRHVRVPGQLDRHQRHPGAHLHPHPVAPTALGRAPSYAESVKQGALPCGPIAGRPAAGRWSSSLETSSGNSGAGELGPARRRAAGRTRVATQPTAAPTSATAASQSPRVRWRDRRARRRRRWPGAGPPWRPAPTRSDASSRRVGGAGDARPCASGGLVRRSRPPRTGSPTLVPRAVRPCACGTSGCRTFLSS